MRGVEELESITVGRHMRYRVTGSMREAASGDHTSQESRVRETGLVDGQGQRPGQEAAWEHSRMAG